MVATTNNVRQAILTKYHGPTNKRAARVSAQATAGRIVVEYDHRHNVIVNHAEAARKLAEKFGWKGRLHGGSLPIAGRSGAFAWVFENE